MEQTLSAAQDAESNQAAVAMADDSSAKTIEFLRVRLLAERAASKAARQQAQEISAKVKALNAELEAEMENRKAAEMAMRRVFSVLKAKGLDVEGLASGHGGESLGSTADDIKEMNQGPQDSFSGYTANPHIDTAEPHACSEENPSLQNHDGHGQLALLCSSSITQKLKAMLQQMEVEVLLLPTERQPLKLELQGWVEHMARVLEKERETAMAMETQTFDSSAKAAAANYPFKETTVSRDLTNALTDNNGVYAPTMPVKMLHSRRLSCDSLQSWPQQPLNKPIHPQMMKNGIPSHSLRCPDSFTPNTPRRSDAFSIGDASFLCAGFQKDRGRGLGLEGPAMSRSRQLLSRPYAVGASDKLLMTQDRYMDLGHMPLNKGHAYPDQPYIGAVRDAAAEFNAVNAQHRTSIPQHQTSLPPHDAGALSLVDVTKGRLGDTLMALDAARQHVGNGEQSLYAKMQLLGAAHTPRSMKTKAKGGYPCGYEPAWRSLARSQAPIIQLPPSPASEHGYSHPPLESYSRHSRSSSVSNYIMSGWQHKGEVKLGNGITLYTD